MPLLLGWAGSGKNMKQVWKGERAHEEVTATLRRRAVLKQVTIATSSAVSPTNKLCKRLEDQ